MKIHQLSIEEVLAGLRTDTAGLRQDEVRRRAAEFGPNLLEEVPGPPAWLRYVREITQLFSLLLWTAAVLAFFAEGYDPGQGMGRVGFALVTVILISGAFSTWQESRAERTLAALRKLLPRRVKVMRDGCAAPLDAAELVPGDILLLEAGDAVPADCCLIEAYGVRVDNSSITGESLPKSRAAGPSDVDDLLYSRNVVLAGTSIVTGQARAVVFATGARTEFGRIARLTQAEPGEPSPLTREIAHLSRLVAALSVCVGMLFFAIGTRMGIPLREDVLFAIGILVCMVPEGLLPTLTLSLVLATQRMARRNVLIRYLPAVEALGSTTVICTDKTGTLTQNRMEAREALLGDTALALHPHDVCSSGGAGFEAFFSIARMCHDLKPTAANDARAWLGDPMEVALVTMADRLAPGLAVGPRVDEIPFDADRMRLSTVHTIGEDRVLYCKGAPEVVLPLCASRLTERGEEELDDKTRQRLAEGVEGMARRGLRVLALAYRPLAPGTVPEAMETALILAGLVGLEDPPRPDVREAIQRCREAGIKVIMITGDHPRTALAIARGIDLVRSANPLVVTGEELRRMSQVQVQLALDAAEIVFARVAANQKMGIVEALKNKKQIVAVTGDGVNDAPALRAAHIGISMGISGTDVAKEAADLVLLDDHFASIVNAIEEGRAVFDNIRKFLTYVLVHNVAELVPYLAFVVLRVPLALTPLQALTIDVGTDSLTALGLGCESPDAGIMRRPPRPPHERLVDRALALRAYAFLGPIEAAAGMAAFLTVLLRAGWHPGEPLASADPAYAQATAATLTAIIVMQIVNVFLCRSDERPVSEIGVGGNRLIIWGVVLELALISAIVYSAAGNVLLGTAPVPAVVFATILPFALGMLLLEEGRKRLVR